MMGMGGMPMPGMPGGDPAMMGMGGMDAWHADAWNAGMPMVEWMAWIWAWAACRCLECLVVIPRDDGHGWNADAWNAWW